MQTIKLTDVIIKDRVRAEFDEEHVTSLADSIARGGLLNPITLAADRKTLVAGETRHRAITKLTTEKRLYLFNGEEVPLGHIPYTSLADMGEDHVLETELEENLKRRDLNWREKAQGLLRLHNLRSSQAETRGEQQTVRATVDELINSGVARSESRLYADMRVAQDLAEHLDDPDVAQAPDAKTAQKIVRKKLEAKANATAAASFDPKASPHAVRNGNSLELLGQLQDQVVDVLLTDPPYGMSAHEFGSMASEVHAYEDTDDWLRENMPHYVREWSRVCKADAHAYVFCDPDKFSFLRQLFIDAGWKVHRTPMIWAKNTGMLPWPDHGPRRTYEMILYAVRGDLRTTAIYSDVVHVSAVGKPKWGAEKPSRLYHELLKRSARPGMVVLDTFAGAGPIIPAANASKCRAVAFELETEKYNHILTRMDEGVEEE